jgi:hypothetical protein
VVAGEAEDVRMECDEAEEPRSRVASPGTLGSAASVELLPRSCWGGRALGLCESGFTLFTLFTGGCRVKKVKKVKPVRKSPRALRPRGVGAGKVMAYAERLGLAAGGGDAGRPRRAAVRRVLVWCMAKCERRSVSLRGRRAAGKVKKVKKVKAFLRSRREPRGSVITTSRIQPSSSVFHSSYLYSFFF